MSGSGVPVLSTSRFTCVKLGYKTCWLAMPQYIQSWRGSIRIRVPLPDGRTLNSFKDYELEDTDLWKRKAESRETQEIKSNNCRICVVGIIKITLYQPGVRVTLFLFWTFETAGKITGGFQSIPSLAVPEISRHQWDSAMMDFGRLILIIEKEKNQKTSGDFWKFVLIQYVGQEETHFYLSRWQCGGGGGDLSHNQIGATYLPETLR